jgi:hypothetical protein
LSLRCLRGYRTSPLSPSFGKLGLYVGDRAARARAIAEIWKAVDAGMLRPMAIGGRPRKILSLHATLTKQIPSLRSARGRGFTYLRQSNPAHRKLAAWFGPDLPAATLAFREKEVQKLARRLMRARRATLRSGGDKKPRGRPARQGMVVSSVQEIIESGKLTPLSGLKALTQLVNRMGKWERPVSTDTVARVLYELYQETRDRRFERVRRKRRPAAK